MNVFRVFTVASLFLVLAAGSAMAIPVLGGEDPDLQEVLNSITVSPTPDVSSVDVTTDYLADTIDSYWNVTASGSAVATMIIEVAGNSSTNTFGVFDRADETNRIQLFNGSATQGNYSLLTVFSNGDIVANHFSLTGVFLGQDSGMFSSATFGFYLSAPDDVFFSDTNKNTDGVDHMLAYQGTNTDTVKIGNLSPGLWTNNEYILAWEDLSGGGDMDFQDMVLMVESVNPIPEPGTILLLGGGLLGLAYIKRRRQA